MFMFNQCGQYKKIIFKHCIYKYSKVKRQFEDHILEILYICSYNRSPSNSSSSRAHQVKRFGRPKTKYLGFLHILEKEFSANKLIFMLKSLSFTLHIVQHSIQERKVEFQLKKIKMMKLKFNLIF